MGKIVASILTFIFMAYHMFGAGIFDILEREEEAKRRALVFSTHRLVDSIMCPNSDHHCLEDNATENLNLDLASHFANITGTTQKRFEELSNSQDTARIADVPRILLSARELDNLIRNVTSMAELATKTGIDPHSTEKNNTPEEWIFPKTNHFCMTVLTTIGYGRFSPATEGGRLFCIFYGLFGIPFTVVIFAIVGEAMKEKVQLTADFITARVPHNWSPKNVERATVAFYLTVGNLLFVMVPAVVFVHVEDWSYTESFYYIFVTLSTVGFGDFMANRRKGVDYSTAYVIARLCWLYIGLSYFSVIFYLMTKAIQDGRSKLEERVKTAKDRVREVTSAKWNNSAIGKRRVRRIHVAHVEPTEPTGMATVD
ncbi:potassium channel subfamily K member 10-like [Branchiostoma lanceolatum]|uniref:potassium channel subfamily K member 10-like n=1 Tax=Branchiostoma lanceolatum TaxID=7740 RepID=UPI0034550628